MTKVMMTMIDDVDYGDGWICSMKMLNNVLGADVFEISRLPIQ